MGFSIKKIQSVYKSVYSQQMREKQYTEAKIYHGGKDFDLKKRWYVYYSYLNPETGKMQRQTPITFNINRRYKTKKERLFELNVIKNIVNDFLKAGESPLHIKNTFSESYSSEWSLDYALSVKKKEIITP